MVDLPMVLIMDILSRLPVIVLLRFRCVSKSWKYLIDDSDLINLHLQHSLENTTNHAMVIRSSYLYLVNFPALDEAVVMDHPLKYDSLSTLVVGSCNGLLCLSNGEGRGKEGTIVYNPATKKRRELPVSKINYPEYFTCPERLVYGFGYDLANDDYKVVRIIQFYNDIPDFYDSEVKVFSLKTSSWRRVQDFPPEYYLSFKRQSGVYVNGCLHWMVILKPDSDKSKLIVAFDLTSEDCKVVPLPNYSAGEVHLTIEVLDQHLCLLINYPTIRSEVWVMKEYGVQESWTKLFAVMQGDTIGPFEYVRPIAFSKDGSKVLLEQDLSKFIWFDVETQRAERVNICGMPSHPEAGMLVESLVLGSRKTHHNKKSNERRRLASANIAALPNSSTTHVVSGRTPDFDNVTGNLKKNQEALDGNQNIRKKGKRDNLEGFLSKGFKLKL
ncbi:hypothetical protein BVRB_8g201740 [Beta vulgaris subsp. vulgaris]|uniref:F-box domain-containing protein n=1 Tax=Beta vulgaris subsp. vulgaris TaxID=3555 RepID=A0A0J8B9B4_BETVV|nr:hypothetical protein BVRB_8g201740 [Beta vulgaris subsp. vulgaris]